MRQVPQNLNEPIIVGKGKLAKHLAHYFVFKNIRFSTWHRPPSSATNESSNGYPELIKSIKPNSTVLLAISDDALVEVIEEIRKQSNCEIVHFSGSLYFKDAIGAHPLMTFGNDLYQKEFYETIPFVIDQKGRQLLDFLPGLENPSHFISPELKSLYHSYCVMSCNFPMLLWQAAFKNFEKQLGLPKPLLFPILKKSLENSLGNIEIALTGPLVRQDKTVLRKNLAALKKSPEEKLFQSFIEYFQAIQSQNKQEAL